MTDESKCLKCGAPLARDARDGVCPKCILEQALSCQGEDESAGSSSSPAPSEGPGRVIGRYKLLQQIGQGGMGTVWMAEQSEPVRRIVALKLIKPGMDSAQVLARFEAERQALALMDHPNIARVLDAGATPNGRPYFVMDLVKGIPLMRFCDEQRLAVRERLELFIQVCQAVQHAHQKGIIHRDLKPSNVLVALYDGKPVPKVIDFGLAKATGQRLTTRTLVTEYGAVLGSLEYMSPEQAELNQLDIDTRSDIYSLGVLLYELLTGTTPLTREALKQTALDEVLRRIREEEPPRPSQRLSTTRDRLPAISAQRKLEPEKLTKVVQGELDWIVMKALEKDRSQRYETANGLARDLQRYLNDEPVMAGPPTVRYWARKFVRKHRMEVAVATGFVVLLAVASVVSAGLALWANQERVRADGLAKKESAARTEADAQRTRALGLLDQMQIQRAEDYFAADDSARAVAYLASVLRRDVSNHVAAERLLSALTFRNFSLAVTEPLQHEGDVLSAQFSPDGRRLFTVSRSSRSGRIQGSLRVWDAQTGKLLAEPLPHELPVNSARFSPDGLRIATVSDDKTVRVWDAQTGKPLTEPLRHEGDVLAAQFSPDGCQLVTASVDKTVRVWDAQTGKSLAELLRHENPVTSAQFSPDGRWVVTASVDKTARVWDTQTCQPVTGSLRHEEPVLSTQFSPDGRCVVTTSHDKTARVWDAQTGKPLAESLRHEDGVSSAQFSPDGRRVVTASEDKTVRVWDAQTGKPLTEPLRHEGPVRSARFSPDGQQVVTASGDETARVWDAQTGKPLTQPLRHEGPVLSAQFSLDGRRVVTASWDRTARVWDAQTGQPLTEPLWHEGEVWSAEFSPDGRRVVTASLDKTARVWELPFGPMPAPPWLPELAEGVVGKRATGAGVFEPIEPKEFFRLKQQVLSSTETNYYVRWAKWFCSDPSTRPLSPLSTIAVPEYVHGRIEENTLESLREAVSISPTNGLAYARLARQVLAQSDKDNPRRVGEADFFSRYAVKLAPNDAEVLAIRAEIKERIKDTPKP